MTASTTVSSPHVPALTRALGAITMEHLAYAGVVALALVLRLANLGLAPMTPDEAAQAVAALDRAGSYAPVPGLSPLLLNLHAFTFFVARAGEASARLWPALAGALTVTLAYGLRAELGRLGALAAALLLALSSTLVFVSRSATGASLALLAGMALIVGLAGWRRTGGSTAWATWLAVALALLLLSAPIGYSLLLATAPLALLALWPQGEPRSAPVELKTPVLVFVLLLVLGGTGLFFQPGGLAAVADLPAAWLAGFAGDGAAAPSLAMTAQGASVTALAFNLLWLDPLLLTTGLAGLVVGLRRRQWLAIGLGMWLAVALVLLLVRGGRSPADLAVLALPLALLGGLALGALAHRFDWGEQRAEAVVLLAAGLVILGSIAVWLADYTQSLRTQPQTAFLISAGVAALVLVGLFAAYVVIFGPRVTARIALVLGLVAVTLLGLRGMALTSHNQHGLRWGSHAQVTGASGGPELVLAMERLAAQRGSDLRDLPVALLTAPGNQPAPLLRWYTRDTAQRPLVADDPNLVWLGLSSDPAPPAGGQSSGQSFRIAQRWSPDGLTGRAWWNWLLFGRFDALRDEQRAVLWAASSVQ